MHIHTSKDLKEALRHGPYAWPGGYPVYFATSEGYTLSFQTVKDNYKNVLRSVRHDLSDGWRVIGMDINWESELYDDYTGKQIESAYEPTYEWKED